MAVHQVLFEVPSRPVGKVDIVFTIRENGQKFGELRISKGNLMWTPANKQKRKRLSWKKLDALAREFGTDSPG